MAAGGVDTNEARTCKEPSRLGGFGAVPRTVRLSDGRDSGVLMFRFVHPGFCGLLVGRCHVLACSCVQKTGLCKHATDPRGDRTQTVRSGAAIGTFIISAEICSTTARTVKIIRAGERKGLKIRHWAVVAATVRVWGTAFLPETGNESQNLVLVLDEGRCGTPRGHATRQKPPRPPIPTSIPYPRKGVAGEMRIFPH